MARQLELNGRQFLIVSEPHASPAWKAIVLEVTGAGNEAVGIQATAATRGAADEAAEKKLRRLLRS